MINKYPGECRFCWQPVPAGAGEAHRRGGVWEVQHPGASGNCPTNPHNPSGAATIEISRGEGYGGTGWDPGQIVREQWHEHANPARLAFPGHRPANDSGLESGIAVVVAARAIYYSHEGMSFGVGDDAGHLFMARLRPATHQQAAPILDRERVLERRAALSARVRAAFAWRYLKGDAEWVPEADVPDLQTLPHVPLGPPGRSAAHALADELRVEESAGRVWTLVYNSADGDNWEANNAPGRIALSHPLTQQRRSLIADLRAEYGDSPTAYVEAGLRADTASQMVPLLQQAGITADQLGRLSPLRLTTSEDIAAYTARTSRQWADAGWGQTSFAGRFDAADAARLADAGITAHRATALRSIGYRTTTDILSARPPAVPGDATRITVRNGHAAFVTDDPDTARDWLARDPRAWKQPLQIDTTPLRCVHVTANATNWVGGFGDSPDMPWQLWDDGSITLGGWLRPIPHHDPYEPPRSLTDAAEHAITLAVSSTNSRQEWGPPGDRSLRGPLCGITGRTTRQIDRSERQRARSGETWTLHRHDYDHPDGPITIWQLVEEGWAMGEDGDYWASYTTHRTEQAARQALSSRGR